MNVHLVMGLPHSGKTYYIYKNGIAENAIYIDVLDVQSLMRRHIHREDAISELSYFQIFESFAQAMEEAKANKKDVVLEFIGDTFEEREPYIAEAKKQLAQNDQLIGHWIHASNQTIASRLDNEASEKMQYHCSEVTTEVPKICEGYTQLKLVESSGFVDKESQILEQARWHCGYTGDDPKTARNLFKQWTNGEMPNEYYVHVGAITIRHAEYMQKLAEEGKI